jgi:sugar-phosphatase
VLIEVFGVSPGDATALLQGGMNDKRAEVASGPPLREIPGAAAFVRLALGAGIPCALASSASTVNIGLALESIGLHGAFDVVIDEGQVSRGKPAPDPYLAAARGLGVEPRHCVVFEDTAVGIDAGVAAGARCVGVDTLRRPEMLKRADLVIADFRGQVPEHVLHDLDSRRT